MATTDLFRDAVFKDGAFTSNDPKVRAYALQKTMKAMDLGVEFGAKVYVFWGGREGTESDATKNPVEAGKRFREALNFLCGYAKDQKYDLKFALEPKPNEPRGDIYLATVGHALAFINTLDHPEMVGVNPEVAHETMAGLNFLHGVAQAWDAGKLFHIDLNDQNPSRYDQDFRFGAVNPKNAFLLVKFLEDVKYNGSRHFDAHAYRTEDYEGVKDFARGCMRTYLILKEKAARWNADPDIQALVAEINADDGSLAPLTGAYSTEKAAALKSRDLQPASLALRGLPYERLARAALRAARSTDHRGAPGRPLRSGHEVPARHRHLDHGDQGARHRRARKGRDSGRGGVSVRDAPTGLDRAIGRALLGRDGEEHPRGAGPGGPQRQ